jgi:hypothetical protein
MGNENFKRSLRCVHDKLGQLTRQVIEACKESKNRVKKKNITDTRTRLRKE